MKKALAIALTILFFLLQLSAIPFTTGVDTNPKKCGDLIISTPTWYNNTTITVNGNLTITGTGALTLHNTTVLMNCLSNGSYEIHVLAGGKLFAYDNDDNNATTGDASVLTSPSWKKAFLFIVEKGAFFEMKNSLLKNAGYCYGVFHSPEIRADNVNIENCTIENSIVINLTYSIGSHIHGCEFKYNLPGIQFWIGIQLTCSNYSVIDNNLFTGIGAHIDIIYSDHITLNRNTILNGGGMVGLGDYSTISNNTLTTTQGFDVEISIGGGVDDSIGNLVYNNTLNGNYVSWPISIAVAQRPIFM